MGFMGLLFSVLAYNAPMVVVVGITPIMVGTGAGLGTPMSFIAAGLVLGAFAVGFTRMAKLQPKPGGFYSMITAGLGRKIGLGAGLVAPLGYFCVYAGTFPFAGVVLGELVHGTLHGPDLPWYVWSLVFWIACAILGYLKVELSAKVLTVFLFLELAVIVVYDTSVFLQGGFGHAGISAEPLALAHWFDGAPSLGLLLALGMYGGFEVTVLFREEVRNPSRIIPRATYAVIAVAMITYSVSSLAFLNSLGVANAVDTSVADPTAAMAQSIEAFGGKILTDAATVLTNTSTFAVILAAHNITARYFFNLSADGILPRKLSGVHSRHGSPHISSLATSAAGLLLIVVTLVTGVGAIDMYTAMLGMSSFVILAVIFICAIAVPIYMHRHGQAHSVWSRIVFPVLSIVGLGTGLVLAAINFPGLVGGSDGLAAILMALIVGMFLLGVVLATVYRRARPEIYARIGRQ